jgi:tRNA nucleotidyltransferase/poly(A) polymerase
MPGKLNLEIDINDKEKQIFGLIKNVLTKYSKNTVCRVAGGWVRDKLLGKRNDDIDIALDDMSGEELAKLINDELYPGEEKFGLVSQNNEKSKHLETATMKIYNSFVDFVNLRSEKYSDISRVPVIEIGTPEEDARRRDITINSMFYNINTQKVEDFLESGLTDLENGRIRTPLNPEITFADDPLRILRVVRFAVRFQFKIDSTIPSAAKNLKLNIRYIKKFQMKELQRN